MTIPASAPNRYSASKQLISGADFNNLNDHLNSSQGLTATGVAQVDAAQINAANVEILNGSAANAGVRLPVSYPGAEVAILNNSANTSIVYAIGTDVIQNGATGYAAAAAGVNMVTLVTDLFFCIKKGFWQVTKAGGP